MCWRPRFKVPTVSVVAAMSGWLVTSGCITVRAMGGSGGRGIIVWGLVDGGAQGFHYYVLGVLRIWRFVVTPLHLGNQPILCCTQVLRVLQDATLAVRRIHACGRAERHTLATGAFAPGRGIMACPPLLNFS